MGISRLRVINEDKIQPNGGFATHPHENMEIITYILSGQLAHKDSMGNEQIINQGEIQQMSAGSGILHSEYNPSAIETTHLLQIWIKPTRQNVKPRYQQLVLDKQISNELKAIAVPQQKAQKHKGVAIYSDVYLYAATIHGNDKLKLQTESERILYLHIAKGNLQLNGQNLYHGDSGIIKDETDIMLSDANEAEILLFDLPQLN